MRRRDEIAIGVAAGVDYRLVRRVYQGATNVHPALRVAVEHAAVKLGYPVPPATRRFTMNLSEQESAMLRALADDEGFDQSDVIRGDIRKRYEARFGRPAPLALAQETKAIA
jgi:DNA-binding LacI/PurR family transcriptional regulator